MTAETPADLERRLRGTVPGRGLPPVHLWNPPRSGLIDIRILADGSWMHEGGRIGREALVRLFSSVLRRDPDGYWLVTPAEKLKIEVEDAPFLAVRVDRVGGDLVFLTNVGDEVTLDALHPLRVEISAGGEPRPYLHVRRGLEARLTRPVFYELVDMAEPASGPNGDGLALTSGGERVFLGEIQTLASGEF